MMTREEIKKKKEVRLFTLIAFLTLLVIGAALLYTGKISITGLQMLGIQNETIQAGQAPAKNLAESDILCTLTPLLTAILLFLLIMGRAANMDAKKTRVFEIINSALAILTLFLLIPTLYGPAMCSKIAGKMSLIDEIFLFLIITFAIALLEGMLYLWFERKEKGPAEKTRTHGWLLILMLIGTSVVMLTALSVIINIDEYHVLAYLSPVMISALVLAFVVLTHSEPNPPGPKIQKKQDTHMLQRLRITERTKSTVEELVEASVQTEKKLERQSIILLRKAKRKIVEAFRAAMNAWRAKKEQVHRRAEADRRKRQAEERKKDAEKKRKEAEHKREEELSRRLDREKKLETAPSVHYKNPTFSVFIDEQQEKLKREREKEREMERERELRERERELKRKKLRPEGPWTKRVMRSLFPPENKKKKAKKPEKKERPPKIKEPKHQKRKEKEFDKEISKTEHNIEWLQQERRRLRNKGPESREAQRKKELAEIEVYLEVMQKKLSRLERVRRRMI